MDTEKNDLLAERIKELNCLHSLSVLKDNRAAELGDFLQQAVRLIPPAWRFPEIATACICFAGLEFSTDHFMETEWSQQADLIINNIRRGFIRVCYLRKPDSHTEKVFLEEEYQLLNSFSKSVSLYLEWRENQEQLKAIEWMLTSPVQEDPDNVPAYGDLSILNTNGLILKSVGKEQLHDIVSEYLELLQTSSAIYERNGDYALGIFSSGWCRMMDSASRQLCGTVDNRDALACGKWLCHESCWKEASIEAMIQNAPVDIKCQGGIRLFAVPVLASGEVVGAVNFGYGDPPKNEDELLELSAKYNIPPGKLKEQALSYRSRPGYIIEFAKTRIVKAAQHLGTLVELHLSRLATLEREENLRTTLNSIGDAVIATDTHEQITVMNPVATELTGWSLREAYGQPISKVFRIVDNLTGKRARNPVRKVLSTGKPLSLANHTKLVSKNGHEYQIADSGAPIFNKQGEITGVIMVFRDVTDEYQMREQLRQSERRYHELFRNIRSCVAVYGAVDEGMDFEILDFNRAAEQAENVVREEVIGKRVTQVFPGVGLFGILEVFQRVWATGNPEYFPLSEYIDGRISGWRENYIYKLPSGEVVALYEDVTERKKAEDFLRFKQEMHARTEQLAQIGSWEWDVVHDQVVWSEEVFRIFQIDPSMGAPPFAEHQALFEPEDAEKLQRAVNKSIETGDPYELHLTVIRSDGTRRNCMAQGMVLRNKAGEVQRLYGFLVDITEKLRAEEKVRESEDTYRNLFQNAPVGLFRTRISDGKILEANNQIAQMFGYANREEYIAEYVTSGNYVEPGRREIMLEELRQNGFIRNFEAWFFRKDRSTFLACYSAKVFPDKGWIEGVVEDITERKKVQEDLLAAKTKAEESDRLKSAFLANMSHEIRTPMNGILGFTALLNDPELTGDEQQRYIEIIQNSGKRLLTTVNDLIDISRIETGQMPVALTSVNLRELMLQLVGFFLPEAEKKGLKLILAEFFVRNDRTINTDQHKLDSVLSNLIRNAIKFTDQGTILLSGGVQDNMLEFVVKDTGIGIPENRLEAIFNRFEQADLNDRRARQGSGLGLSIAKAYIDMLGGNISVSSTVGKGTTFRFTIPLKTVTEG